MAEADLLDAAALAERWGVSPETLRNWRALRKGPTYIKVGSRVRYKRADVISWEEQQSRREVRS